MERKPLANGKCPARPALTLLKLLKTGNSAKVLALSIFAYRLDLSGVPTH
jgi:hypothetical protein